MHYQQLEGSLIQLCIEHVKNKTQKVTNIMVFQQTMLVQNLETVANKEEWPFFLK